MKMLDSGRLARAGVVALVATSALGAGCRTKKASAIVVAISSEAKAPTGVDSLELKIDRGASTPFFQTYAVSDGEAHLPGTITLEKDPTEDASGPISITITARVAGTHHVLRRATLGFVEETTKLLKMPLRFSCLDFPTATVDNPDPDACGPGRTCRGGACVSDAIDVASLPDFAPSLVDTVAAPGAACFDDTSTTDGCFASSTDVVDLTVVQQKPDGTCTIETGGSSTGSGGSVGTDAGAPMQSGEDAGSGVTPHDGGPAEPPDPPDAGSFGGGTTPGLNLALNWRVVSATDSTTYTTLDFDPIEGWQFDGASRTRAVLSAGICAAIKAAKVGGIRYSTKCDPKTLERPLCEKTSGGDFGIGGHDSGAAGTSSSGIGGGKNQGGTTGSAGASSSAGGGSVGPPSLANSNCVKCLEANTCSTSFQAAKSEPAITCALACSWTGQICQPELDCANACEKANPSALSAALLSCIENSTSGDACAPSCLLETSACAGAGGASGTGGSAAHNGSVPGLWKPGTTYTDAASHYSASLSLDGRVVTLTDKTDQSTLQYTMWSAESGANPDSVDGVITSKSGTWSNADFPSDRAQKAGSTATLWIAVGGGGAGDLLIDFADVGTKAALRDFMLSGGPGAGGASGAGGGGTGASGGGTNTSAHCTVAGWIDLPPECVSDTGCLEQQWAGTKQLDACQATPGCGQIVADYYLACPPLDDGSCFNQIVPMACPGNLAGTMAAQALLMSQMIRTACAKDCNPLGQPPMDAPGCTQSTFASFPGACLNPDGTGCLATNGGLSNAMSCASTPGCAFLVAEYFWNAQVCTPGDTDCRTSALALAANHCPSESQPQLAASGLLGSFDTEVCNMQCTPGSAP